MLSDGQLDEVMDVLGLPDSGRDLVRAVRRSPPAKSTESSPRANCTRYASKKMCRVIQAANDSGALPYVIDREHEESLLEYFDYPPPISMEWINKAGKKKVAWQRPAYFCIWKDRIGWVEVRHEEQLLKLEKAQPNKYQRAGDGTWRCPPGEEHAAKLGLGYWIVSSASFNWKRQNNLRFLSDYLDPKCPPVADIEVSETLEAVAQNRWMYLEELLETPGMQSDVIYKLIVDGRLLCNLEDECLHDPERVRLFADEGCYEAFYRARESYLITFDRPIEFILGPGDAIDWDGKRWNVLNVGDSEISLRDSIGKVVALGLDSFRQLANSGSIRSPKRQELFVSSYEEILRKASPSDLENAAKFDCLYREFMTGEQAIPKGHPQRRTLFRKRKAYRDAQIKYGNGFVGLIDQNSAKGRRELRYDKRHLRLIRRYIKRHYLNSVGVSAYHAYGKYRRAIKKWFKPVSLNTYLGVLGAQAPEEVAFARAGVKAAYQVGPFHWVLEFTTPRHGARPYEFAHIDHTELEIELICTKTGVRFRPWLTVMMDANTRRMLAFVISDEPPSHRSCMMVLRECVRRNGRLPEYFIVDNGSEFHSTYFQVVVAQHARSIRYRPRGHCRAGAVMERLFGVTQSQLVHNIVGNTKLMRNVRQVSKAVNPKALAAWTLPEFVPIFEEYFDEHYNKEVHPALGMSPIEAEREGLRRCGERKFKLISYDATFLFQTCPAPKKKESSIDRQAGITVNYIQYWHEKFAIGRLDGRQVPTRFDPYDLGHVYAFVDGEWLTCLSEIHAQLKGRSLREIQLASLEIATTRRWSEMTRAERHERLVELLSWIEDRERAGGRPIERGEGASPNLNFTQAPANNGADQPTEEFHDTEGYELIGGAVHETQRPIR